MMNRTTILLLLKELQTIFQTVIDKLHTIIKQIEDEDEEEDEDEDECTICQDTIHISSNQWGGGQDDGYYCVPCYTDILAGRKTLV